MPLGYMVSFLFFSLSGSLIIINNNTPWFFACTRSNPTHQICVLESNHTELVASFPFALMLDLDANQLRPVRVLFCTHSAMCLTVDMHPRLLLHNTSHARHVTLSATRYMGFPRRGGGARSCN
jgi:hypothetical protein